MDKAINMSITEQKTWISVLLCTYNDGKYIAETIESILNQTYPYFEFIIINDGSTDNTGEIIDAFRDPRIKHIKRLNHGLTKSLNFGITQCQYNWIARIDGDDVALPNRFEKQLEYINSNVAAIGTQYKHIDSEGNIIANISLPLSHKNIIRRGITGATMFNHPSVLINKKLLNQVGDYDEHIDAAEDLDLWLKLSHYGRLINVDIPLMLYRMHENKISIYKRETQYTNAQVAILKFRSKIHKNLTDFEYSRIRKKLEKSSFFHIGKILNSKSNTAKGFELKFINLAFRINQILINIFIKKITNE
ncbi:glycosyltransferase [Chryseobacterium sp. C-71]|uniref:glycosyltransferase n=1 Tax=Chryseobacterium sp. C-71 TaxID=2893882 RepID=UPI001E40EB69|nr:glycosyltransferase [Chryseobacterium sp. C-71]UFH33335.1 glycosyltransferase [Chryseobacterium sp. C-71]